MKAEQYIKLYERAEAEAVNYKNLCQNTADLISPRDNNIVTTTTQGEEKTVDLIDPTGQMASMEMVAGLSINLFPPGQKFYNLVMSDRRLNELDSVKRALGQITEISHEARVASNFTDQSSEVLKSLVNFGTGNMYSEYKPGMGLNYKAWDISKYLIKENSRNIIDTMLIKFQWSARQAYQEWGEDVGEVVLASYNNENNRDKMYSFIWVVRPREERDRTLKNNGNWAFESVFVNMSDKLIVEEGGYKSFPFFVPRWDIAGDEVWGRGPGTFSLPSVRSLQKMKSDLIECGQKHNNPAREIIDTFEGEVRVFSGANNYVTERGTISAIDQGVRGNFPITEKTLEMEQDIVKKMFFSHVFAPFRDLKGDRRTTLEIRERRNEAMQGLGTPIGRIQNSWLDPMVRRDIELLFQNGVFKDIEIPPEMQGQTFEIEYIGWLAMQLKSQQAKGGQQWIGIGAEIEQIKPGTLDNVDIDSAYRRIGETLGVSVQDMTSIEEREAIRQQRAEAAKAQQQAELLAGTAQAYGQTNKAPEEGSAAQKMMEAMTG